MFYYFSKGFAPAPEALTFFLTHRCNLRCKMCGQWGENGATKLLSGEEINRELDIKDYKDLIDGLSGFKPAITLFGGEPLLYKNAPELIAYVNAKGIHCLMITNGSLVFETASKLVESGLDELNVSIDGNREMHDTIRGIPGIFDKIVDGLKKLAQIKKERGTKKPFINIQCTITKYNYKNLEEMLKVAAETGASSLTFHNLIFTPCELLEKQKTIDFELKASSDAWQGFNFAPEIDPEVLFKKINSILKNKYPFDIDFFPNFSRQGLIEYYRNPQYAPREYPARCMSPWLTAYIFPDGEVRPCLNSTFSFGNIRQTTFLEAWNSLEARKFRTFLRKNKVFPLCVRCTELYRY
jgi:MoaA/NifB/PqqE/SkfB family radical SAM enzyme